MGFGILTAEEVKEELSRNVDTKHCPFGPY